MRGRVLVSDMPYTNATSFTTNSITYTTGNTYQIAPPAIKPKKGAATPTDAHLVACVGKSFHKYRQQKFLRNEGDLSLLLPAEPMLMWSFIGVLWDKIYVYERNQHPVHRLPLPESYEKARAIGALDCIWDFLDSLTRCAVTSPMMAGLLGGDTQFAMLQRYGLAGRDKLLTLGKLGDELVLYPHEKVGYAILLDNVAPDKG